MRKWRQDYPLKQKIQKIKILSDEDGITLVELLAAISILSIVILLAGSIHIFGQKQFIEQAESASQANDMNYAMTVITTDLRKLKADEVKIKHGNNILINDNPVYTLNDTMLKKGGTILADNLKEKPFTKDEEGITIKLETIDQIRPKKTYETKIYFRGRVQ